MTKTGLVHTYFARIFLLYSIALMTTFWVLYGQQLTAPPAYLAIKDITVYQEPLSR